MPNYKLGLCSVSFRDHTPEEILSAMKEAGLSYIEWGSDVHAPNDDTGKINRILELQKEYGIQCSSYGTYFRLGETPLEQLEDYIKTAKALGTSILRVWCGYKDSEQYTEEEKEALFCQCREAAVIAERNYAMLCMECHGGTFTNHEKSALALMDAVHSKCFRMYWQPQQHKSLEENLSYARAIRSYVQNVHVFNWSGNQRFPLSDGIAAWKDYLSFFAEDTTLLLEFMPDDRIQSLKTESTALKAIAQ